MDGEDAVRQAAPAAPGRRPDGHPDAGARRDRGDPADHRGPPGDPGADPDHVRAGRVRLRGAPRRGQRLHAQGRAARGDRRRGADRGPRRGAARARRHPGGDRGVRAAATAGRPPVASGRARRADAARAGGARPAAARACRTRRSARGCSSATRPRRPTSPASCRSSASATGCRRSSTPTRTASSERAAPCDWGGRRTYRRPHGAAGRRRAGPRRGPRAVRRLRLAPVRRPATAADGEPLDGEGLHAARPRRPSDRRRRAVGGGVRAGLPALSRGG